MLGLVVASSFESAERHDERPAHRGSTAAILVAALVLLAVSVPIRAQRFLSTEADLEQAAIGFSGWRPDEQGRRVRTMTGRARFYVPAASCGVTLALRADSGASPAEVEIRVDGRVANRLSVAADSWQTTRMSWGAAGSTGFRTIELRTDASRTVRTGAPLPTACASGGSR